MISQTPPSSSVPAEPTRQHGRRGLNRRQVIGGLSSAVVLTGVGVHIWMRIPASEADTAPFADYFTGRAPVMGEPSIDTEHVSTKSWGVRTFLTLEENTPIEDAIALIQSAYTDLAASVEGLAHATLLIGWNGTTLTYEDRLWISGTSLTISATSDVDLSGVPLDAMLAALPGGAEDPARKPIVTLDAVGPGYADGLPAIDVYEQALTLDEAEPILRAFNGAAGPHAIRIQATEVEMRFLLTDGVLTQDPSWHTAEEEIADLLGRV